VFSCVGNLPMTDVVKLAEKHLGHLPKMKTKMTRQKFIGYKPKETTLKRNVKQARVAIGRTAYPVAHEKRSSFFMLTNILGGGGMNSRLNMALREKHGFVYNIGSQFVPFTDTGLFVISYGTEPSQLKKSIELVKHELKKLRDDKLGVKQLASSKEQILGQLAMAEENNIGFMIMMARTLLDLGKITSLEEIFERVKTTSADDLQALANEMFDQEKMSQLIMHP